MLCSKACVIDITSNKWKKNPAQVLCDLSEDLAQKQDAHFEAIIVPLNDTHYAIKTGYHGEGVITLATTAAFEVLQWPKQQNGHLIPMVPYKNFHLAIGGNRRGQIILNSDLEDITEPLKRTGNMGARAIDSRGTIWSLALEAG